MTTARYFLGLCWASRLFPTFITRETYNRYWQAMDQTRNYRWPTVMHHIMADIAKIGE
jgi:hypothetical protein